MHDAVAFLSEANFARNVHLMEFQGNVEKWAADHQQKVETSERQRNEDRQRMAGLEQQLARAQDELLRVATAVPLPATRATRTQPGPPADRSPAAAPMTRLMLGSPLLGGAGRQQRPPAVPADETTPRQELLTTGGAGGGNSPPTPPWRAVSPSHSAPSNRERQ